MVRDAALLLLLLVVAPPHAAGFSSSTDETVAQQLDALAKQLPALAAWAAEAEERLADCCSCTGRTPPEIRGAATAYEGLNKVAVTGEVAAIWLWRVAVGIAVVVTTCIVVPRDKHFKAQAATAAAHSSIGDADSSTDDSLAEWAAAQESAWVQPPAPEEPGSVLHPPDAHAFPLGQARCESQSDCCACTATWQKLLLRRQRNRVLPGSTPGKRPHA